MKNIKLILVSALALALLVVGIKITFAVINDNMERDAAERARAKTQTETEAITFTPIETETEIEFTPIETETETDEHTETEAERESEGESDAALSQSDREVQQIIEEIPDVHVTADEQVNASPAAYAESDLMLLAKVIQNEAGADVATDEHQRAVASVALNRVADPRFPHNTLNKIIMCGWFDGHTIQYNFGSLDAFYSIVPSERAIANAEYVLTHGSTIPPECVWQDNSIQGEIVAVFEYPGTPFGTTYICR